MSRVRERHYFGRYQGRWLNDDFRGHNSAMRIVPRTDKLQRFFALSGPDKWMLLHASVWLALARLMLLFLPFNKLAAKLPGEQGTTTVGVNTELFERIGDAVRAAAGNVPWRSD